MITTDRHQNRKSLFVGLKRILGSALVFAVAIFFVGSANQVHAEDCATSLGARFVSGDEVFGGSFPSGTESLTFTIGFDGTLTGQTVELYKQSLIPARAPWLDSTTVNSENEATFTINAESALVGEGSVRLELKGPAGRCTLATYTLTQIVDWDLDISYSQNGKTNPGCVDTVSGDVTVNVTNISRGGDIFTGEIWLQVGSRNPFRPHDAVNGAFSTTFTPTSGDNLKLSVGYYNISEWPTIRSITIPRVLEVQCTEEAVEESPFTPDIQEFRLCDQVNNDSLQTLCQTCESNEGVWTAIGCVKTDPVSIAQQFITLGLGIGGGVSLIATLIGGFMLTTSQGDPQKASEAREIITSAVIGLIFVIFSVAILQFIGVSVLQIPGFGTD